MPLHQYCIMNQKRAIETNPPCLQYLGPHHRVVSDYISWRLFRGTEPKDAPQPVHGAQLELARSCSLQERVGGWLVHPYILFPLPTDADMKQYILSKLYNAYITFCRLLL